jgi:PAS domain S-box-containing protein
MISTRDLGGWSRRDGLLLLVALALTVLLGYLILANHLAALRQRQAIEGQAQGAADLHALVLGHFLGEQRATVADLAAAPELVAFFENRALGMSPEYGLRQSLLVVDERLDAVRQRKRLDDQPAIARLRFLDREGALLVGSPASAGAATPAALGIGLADDRCSLVICAPVQFRGAEAGRVEATIGLHLLRRLLGPEEGSERAATLLIAAGDQRVLLPDGPIRELPAGVGDVLQGAGGRALLAFDDDEHHHLVVAVPVPGAPLVVVMLRGSDRVLGSEPWHVLVLLAGLSVVLLGGAVALVRHMVRTRQLGARVTELEVRGELESARNRETLGREISARKQAEEQRTQLGYAVEQAAEAILITDAGGTIEYVNPAFTAITGWSREDAVGRNPRILNSGLHDQAFFEAMWRELLAGRPWSGRLVNRRRDGTLIHEDTSISPVRDGEGRVVRFVTVMRDVTALIRMEEQLRQAQKLESIGQLAAGMAHEINTPIQFIGDNLRFLASGVADLERVLAVLHPLVDGGGDSAAARKAVEEADLPYLGEELPKAIAQGLEGVERVAVIVRAMKEFSHPGSQTMSPADLNHAIESTVTVSRNEWKYVAELELRLDPGLPPVPLLVGDFNQVMLNLIVNAAHALADRGKLPGEHPPGRIVVSSAQVEGMVEVRVADNGCGIPAAVQRRIFEPFFTTKEVGRGTGQGLALARAVITGKLHGTIRFESTDGVGTTFIITLPLALAG